MQEATSLGSPSAGLAFAPSSPSLTLPPPPSSGGSAYGRGRKQPMTFGSLLDRLASGDDSLYLSAQEVAAGSDGHPEVLGHPMKALSGDFDLRPALAGNLIPQQV